MKIATYAVIPSLLAASAQWALASDVPQLAEGSRVRVTLVDSAKRVKGTLGMLDQKVLTLDVDHNKQPLTFERTAVKRLELSRGRSPWRAAGLGLVGGVAGLGVAIVSLWTIHDCWNECDPGEGNYLLALPIIGMAGGVALGSRERWHPVDPLGPPAAPAGKVGLRLAPRAGGMGISVAVRF